ncbi:AraC family transcriptional regulator [Undibacterium jejuense]|uniref:AraC family transcriptional regulator n=1 Tax=Undibacterium jejuense TaxID=1344949 RepID=A0A923HF11_9BURK|nr:AraC family transcriptional regulator [Undibacterium jejuense]MBC3862831.1 AraC family transcriptional regulator [Undibacterium jejuense]
MSDYLSYERRLLRVTNYVHEHLDEELDLNKLAEIACMSPYHWHRVYQGVFGESVVATVKRLRLQRAATLLARTTTPIEEIGALSGYPNLQSFTRIFSAVYGIPPARFRKEGRYSPSLSFQPTRSDLMFPVEIRNATELSLICVPHTGSYMGISKAFDTLNACITSRQLYTPTTRWIGIFMDDPAAVEETRLRSFACITAPEVPTEQSVESPLIRKQLAGGTYAVLRYKGPYSEMQPVYQWFCGIWFPASGYEIADAPPYEDYLNNPRETPPSELLTDIYIAIKA